MTDVLFEAPAAGVATGHGAPAGAVPEEAATPAGRHTALRFTVYGNPAPQGSKSGFAIKKGGVYTGRVAMKEGSDKVKPWRQDVVAAAQAAINDLPEFLNPLTGQRARGLTHTPDWSAGAIEYSDGHAEPLPRAVSLLPLDGPVVVSMVFTFTRPRSHYRTGRNAHLLKPDAPTRPTGKPDLDKLARSSCDALTTAGVVRDDARIVEYARLAKVWCGEDPMALATSGAVFEIWPVSPR